MIDAVHLNRVALGLALGLLLLAACGAESKTSQTGPDVPPKCDDADVRTSLRRNIDDLFGVDARDVQISDLREIGVDQRVNARLCSFRIAMMNLEDRATYSVEWMNRSQGLIDLRVDVSRTRAWKINRMGARNRGEF